MSVAKLMKFSPFFRGFSAQLLAKAEAAVADKNTKLLFFLYINVMYQVLQLFMLSHSTQRKKRGGVAVKTSYSEIHIHWKGAAEIVLASCKRYIDANGRLVPMDDNQV